jgi:hypothetical protein
MVGEPVETRYAGGSWQNSIGPEGPALGEYPSREAAVEAARAEARVRGVQHVVRGLDGEVIERNRYPRRSEEIPG